MIPFRHEKSTQSQSIEYPLSVKHKSGVSKLKPKISCPFRWMFSEQLQLGTIRWKIKSHRNCGKFFCDFVRQSSPLHSWKWDILQMFIQAYKKWVAKHGEEPALPGLNLTHDQLFFLNYAQIWCGSMRPQDALTKIRSSVHSPGPIRVLGPLSNSK